MTSNAKTQQLHSAAIDMYEMALECGWVARPLKNGGVMLSCGDQHIPLAPVRQWNQGRVRTTKAKIATHGVPAMVAAWREKQAAAAPAPSHLSAVPDMDTTVDKPADNLGPETAPSPVFAGPEVDKGMDMATVASIGAPLVKWVMPRVVSEVPWVTLKDRESGAVLDRTLSDGTHIYVCAHLGCSYSNARPNSVGVHYARALDHPPAISRPVQLDPRYLAGNPNRTLPMSALEIVEEEVPDSTIEAIRKLVSPKLLAELSLLRGELADAREQAQLAITARDSAVAALATLQGEWDAVAGMMAGRR